MGAAAEDRGYFASGEIWSAACRRRPRFAGGHDCRGAGPRSLAAIQLRRGAAPDARLVSRPTQEIALGQMESEHIRRIRVIDSHTGGEPTRVVLSGFPELGRQPVTEQLATLRLEDDRERSAVIRESPR